MIISTFRTVGTVEPEQRKVDWPELVKLLTTFKRRKSKGGRLWSPVSYMEGHTRGKAGVDLVYCLSIDFDDGVNPEELEPFWGRLGLAYVIHSTWHHNVDKHDEGVAPRWRVVFPLLEPIRGADWDYERLATWLSYRHWDTSCKDCSRFYYLPICPGDDVISKVVDGAPLNASKAPELPKPEPRKTPQKNPNSEGKPGDDYNGRGDHEELLQRAGWTFVKQSGQNEHWRRPGKTRDSSATWHTEKRLFYPFTSSTCLEPNQSYSLFGLKAEFDHGADYAAAAKELYQMGYGERVARAPRLDIVPPPTDDDAPPDMMLSAQPGTDIPGPEDWRRGLTTHKGEGDEQVLDKTPGNLALLLAHDKKWAGCIRFDELAYAVVWADMAPHIPGMRAPEGQLADDHLVYVQQAARRQWGVTWGIQSVMAALNSAARIHSYHPVRNYLDGLKWDGKERLTGWLQTYHRAQPTEVPVGRWWLISAMARACDPGCQVDHLVVLQGRQGSGKSTCLRTLGGEWYSGNLGDLRSVDGPQSLLGSWMVEIGELDALKKAESTKVKDFISQTSDHYRPSYGRCFVDRPRQCVFAGTTNEREYLRDATGSRRFWPVTVGNLDKKALAKDRDQLLAEALTAYRASERWWPEGGEEAKALEAETESRFAADPWEELIRDYLVGKFGEVTMSNLFDTLGVESGNRTPWDSQRVGAIMRRAGWDQQRSAKSRYWVRL